MRVATGCANGGVRAASVAIVHEHLDKFGDVIGVAVVALGREGNPLTELGRRAIAAALAERPTARLR